MEDLNLDKLRESLFQLTRDLLNGKEMKKASVRVTIELPEVLFDAISDLGDQLGMDASTAFQKLANEGIMERMKGLIAGAQPTTSAPAAGFKEAAQSLKGLGLDVGPLMEGLEKMKSMLPQLQGMEKAMQNAGLTDEAKVQESEGPGDGQQDAPKDQENPA